MKAKAYLWTGWTVATVLLGATGCSWKATAGDRDSESRSGGERLSQQAVSAAPSRLELGCDEEVTETLEGLGPYHCGEAFQTEMWGECNDCGDRGCTRAEEGVATCTCLGTVEYCFDSHRDAGESPLCLRWAARCDCGDDKGSIYECACEGGVSTPQECSCFEPRDHTFDHEFECENTSP